MAQIPSDTKQTMDMEDEKSFNTHMRGLRRGSSEILSEMKSLWASGYKNKTLSMSVKMGLDHKKVKEYMRRNLRMFPGAIRSDYSDTNWGDI